MPFLPRGAGAAPQENELSRGQWAVGKKGPQLDTEQKGKKNPRPSSRGRTFNTAGRGLGIYDRSPYSFLLDTSTKQVRFG